MAFDGTKSTDAMAAAPPLTAMEAFRSGAHWLKAGEKAKAVHSLEYAAEKGHALAQWKLGAHVCRRRRRHAGRPQGVPIFPRHRRQPCRGQSGHAAVALRRQRLRRARSLLSRRHSEDRDQARSRPRARDVRLCGLVFPRSGSAILSGAALSRRRRRAARPAPRRRAGSASRRRRGSVRRRRCSAPCCLPATTCRARRRAG